MISGAPANLGVLMDSRDGNLAAQAALRLIAESLVQTHSLTATPVKTGANASIFERAMRHMVDTHRDSALILRNVTVKGKRTTIRLEPEMWDALAEIARQEGYTQTQLCTRIADGQPPGLSFTASVRMFILTYFRTAAHGTPMLSLIEAGEQDFAADFEGKQVAR